MPTEKIYHPGDPETGEGDWWETREIPEPPAPEPIRGEEGELLVPPPNAPAPEPPPPQPQPSEEEKAWEVEEDKRAGEAKIVPTLELPSSYAPEESSPPDRKSAQPALETRRGEDGFLYKVEKGKWTRIPEIRKGEDGRYYTVSVEGSWTPLPQVVATPQLATETGRDPFTGRIIPGAEPPPTDVLVTGKRHLDLIAGTPLAKALDKAIAKETDPDSLLFLQMTRRFLEAPPLFIAGTRVATLERPVIPGQLIPPLKSDSFKIIQEGQLAQARTRELLESQLAEEATTRALVRTAAEGERLAQQTLESWVAQAKSNPAIRTFLGRLTETQKRALIVGNTLRVGEDGHLYQVSPEGQWTQIQVSEPVPDTQPLSQPEPDIWAAPEDLPVESLPEAPAVLRRGEDGYLYQVSPKGIWTQVPELRRAADGNLYMVEVGGKWTPLPKPAPQEEPTLFQQPEPDIWEAPQDLSEPVPEIFPGPPPLGQVQYFWEPGISPDIKPDVKTEPVPDIWEAPQDLPGIITLPLPVETTDLVVDTSLDIGTEIATEIETAIKTGTETETETETEVVTETETGTKTEPVPPPTTKPPQEKPPKKPLPKIPTIEGEAPTRPFPKPKVSYRLRKTLQRGRVHWQVLQVGKQAKVVRDYAPELRVRETIQGVSQFAAGLLGEEPEKMYTIPWGGETIFWTPPVEIM